MKKKLLFIGITMNCAGTEKSFLSFVDCLDFEKYDVDLLLAKKEGLFLDLLPKEVNVIEMPKYGDMFLLSGANAARTIIKCFVRENPLVLFEVLPYFLKIILNKKKRADTATRLWCHLLGKFPKFDDTEYDAAIAYWGDRTMFYMVDCVKAKKKITWLHFDYSNPQRDDKLYLRYFKACDKIVTVSTKVNDALKSKLPEISDRCMVIENINNTSLIRDLALRGDEFPDKGFTGKRILSIGRMSEQKGFDFIIPVLKQLRADGYNLRWYIVGDGEDRDALTSAALDAGVADIFTLLGTTVNPYTYMRDCDLYVMPSRHEGKPITVEEAKVLMKPMVITNYLSAQEQLRGGEYGMICDIDPESIYNAVKKMLDDSSLADAYSLRLSQTDFGNRSEIEKFYEILE